MQRTLAVALLTLAPALAGCGVGGLSAPDLYDGPEGTALQGNPLPGGGTGSAMAASERAFAEEVLRLVNEERARAELPPLLWDEALAGVAYRHSVDMDGRDYFSHDSPDGLGPGERLAAAGIDDLRSWGENIAAGQTSPEQVMRSWMESSGHRANILRASFTHLGVGVHAPGAIWWTQLFGQR